ncbi:MAG: hypothetical protein JF564_07235 [Sphingomonas sp.]|nr:hypothetical protein [Sphingomonas sp.]
MKRYVIQLSLVLLAIYMAMTPAAAQCLQVGDDPAIALNPAELSALQTIGLDRAAIFASMRDTSMPETSGCWAGAAGNFDGQLVSLGLAQWNFGMGSLQPLLRRYREKFATAASFDAEITKLAPTYGELLFSPGCLAKTVTADCQTAFLLHQQRHGYVDDDMAAELNAIFESLPMRQVQTDFFVRLLGRVRDDLARLFPGRSVSGLQVKWAIDSRVQTGFPTVADAARVRARYASLSSVERIGAMKAMLQWYHGLALSPDQQGARADASWNLDQWSCVLVKGISEEQADLLNLTFLRSRIAKTKSGLYQALAFERRAKIIFGVGSVAMRRDGMCRA